MKAKNIKWDADISELEYLPEEISLPVTIKDVEDASDYISDMTGYCHFGFEIAIENRVLSDEEFEKWQKWIIEFQAANQMSFNEINSFIELNKKWLEETIFN